MPTGSSGIFNSHSIWSFCDVLYLGTDCRWLWKPLKVCWSQGSCHTLPTKAQTQPHRTGRRAGSPLTTAEGQALWVFSLKGPQRPKCQDKCWWIPHLGLVKLSKNVFLLVPRKFHVTLPLGTSRILIPLPELSSVPFAHSYIKLAFSTKCAQGPLPFFFIILASFKNAVSFIMVSLFD